MNTAPTPPTRSGPGDPSIRRTWWLLAGAFFVLALISGIELVVFKQPIDWLTAGLVVLAAIAAVAHRNAVAGLEARGRAEAESFARILSGLSRSVSAESIVSAILDDLIAATGADHVVLVRRRDDGKALEARLVTRRPGVPPTTSALPLSLLDGVPSGSAARGWGAGGAVTAGAVAPGAVAAGAVAAGASGPVAVGPGPRQTSRVPVFVPAAVAVSAWTAHEEPSAGAPESGVAAPVGRDSDARPPSGADPDPPEPEAPRPEEPILPRPPVRVRVRAARAAAARAGTRRASDPGGGRTLARRVAAETLALLKDIGLPAPDLLGSRGTARPSEVLARGPEVQVAERIAARVQSVFGLSHTLTAPLRSERGVIGAIVLSRRDRHSWPESARRLVRGAATETASALARADSFREATAGASTDPLTGLPNRRYFDEFSALLDGGRRAGDAVAVLMVDIDRFKKLNDTYGHPAGDHVLRAVAGAITAAVRDHDVPARIGGEEFAVLLRNPAPDVALEVGERVRQAVRDLDLASVGVPGVSVSVGVANARGPEEPVEAILDRADQALLRAKRAGRDRVIAG